MSATSRLLKSRIADVLFVGMVLASIAGLAYQLLR